MLWLPVILNGILLLLVLSSLKTNSILLKQNEDINERLKKLEKNETR